MKTRPVRLLLIPALVAFVLQTASAQWIQMDKLQDIPGGGPIDYMAGSGNTLLAGTFHGNIFFTADKGENWSPVYSVSSGSVTALAVYGDTLLIATSVNGVVLSTDNGGNWDAVNQGLPDNTTVKSMTVSNGYVFGAVGSRVYRTTRTEPRWSPVDSSLPFEVVHLAASGDTIFAGANSGGVTIQGDDTISAGPRGGVFFSSDNGATWTEVDSGISSKFSIGSFAASGNHVFIGTMSGVYHSSMNGSGWFKSDSGLPSSGGFRPVEALAIYGSTLFASFDFEGVFLSADNGKSWTVVNDSFTLNPDMHSLAVCGDYLFAGSSSGHIWRRPLSEMIKSVNILTQGVIPDQLSFGISPIYRSGSDISIALTPTSPTRMTVEIFDMNGREVSTLVNRHLTGDSYRCVWNARGMAQGSYIVQLQAGVRTYIRHMQIVH